MASCGNLSKGGTGQTAGSHGGGESGYRQNYETAAYEETKAPMLKDAKGMTLETRILTPDGYERTEASEGSLLSFMRNMELKEDGSPVLLYNGSVRGNQQAAFAVFAMEVGERDLQQCADSVMRVYAEYDWQRGAYDEIVFPFGNGFSFDYVTWRKGGRLSVNGNTVRWKQTASYDDSYECFQKYMTMTFAYAGTASLAAVCEKIPLEQMKAGDMFLKGGSPGHCVLLVDEAENEQGETCFLLAQGYMPAQDFHVLVNPLHPEDPWYYVKELEFPLKTPQYTFEQDSPARFRDFER